VPAALAPEVASAYAFCTALARARARNFYYAFLLLPAEMRRAIHAVYAFCRYSDDYSDEDLPLAEKQRLLAGYRTRLRACFAGRPDNFVFVALKDTADRYQLPLQYFEELLDGVEMDLIVSRYATWADLERYCYLVAGVVGLICVEIFGYRDPRARTLGVQLGLAMQMTNILRDLQEDIGRDRVYLPQEDLARFGYSEEDLRRGIDNAAFRALMAFEIERTRALFARGRQLIPLVSPRARVCPAALASIYGTILDQIAADPGRVLCERVGLSGWAKMRLTLGSWLTNTLPLRSSSPAVG
jgi:phytoene synthase